MRKNKIIREVVHDKPIKGSLLKGKAHSLLLTFLKR